MSQIFLVVGVLEKLTDHFEGQGLAFHGDIHLSSVFVRYKN